MTKQSKPPAPLKAMNFLVGQVLKKLSSQGKYADPILVHKFMEELIQKAFKESEQEEAFGIKT